MRVYVYVYMYVMCMHVCVYSLCFSFFFSLSLSCFSFVLTIMAFSYPLLLPLWSSLAGYLMDTLGKVNTILVGLVTFACSILVGMSGTSVPHFMVTLCLLGLGWNFTYLGSDR